MPDGVDALCGILDRTIYVGGADLETCVVCIPENGRGIMSYSRIVETGFLGR